MRVRTLLLSIAGIVVAIGIVTGIFLVADWHGATRSSCVLGAERSEGAAGEDIPDALAKAYPEIQEALGLASVREEGEAALASCERGQEIIRAVEEANIPKGSLPGRFLVRHEGTTYEVWLARITA